MTRGWRRLGQVLAVAGALVGANLLASGVAGVIPTACPAGSTTWTNPVGGPWTTAANWTAGVPTADTPACIDLPGSYTVTVDVTPSTPAESLFVGVPGAATQPNLSIVRGTLAISTGVALHGRLTLSPGTGVSSALVAGGAIGIAPTGSLTTAGAGVSSVEGATVENQGSIAANVNLGLRAQTIVNSGAISVASGRLLSVAGPTAGGTPELRLEGGAVTVVGTLSQSAGSLHVDGGAVTGTVTLLAPATLVLGADTGGRFNVGTPAGVADAVAQVSGTVGPTEHLFLGSNAITAQTSGLVNRGQVSVQGVVASGRGPTILETLPGASFRNEGTVTLSGNGQPILRGDIENAASGLIATAGDAVLQPDPFVNRGTLRLTTSNGLTVTGRAADRPPAVILEAGTVDATGGYHQTSGRLEVNGGSVVGQVHLLAPATLALGADTGGRFNVGTPVGVANAVAEVSGTVGQTEQLFIGSNAITAQTPGLLNRGQMTIHSASAAGRGPSILETLSGGSFRNEGTVTLSGNGDPVLRGDVENLTGGLITTIGDAALQPDPIVNSGTIQVRLTDWLTVTGRAADRPPVVVTNGGNLDLAGRYQQTGGRFEWLDGTVTGTGAASFNAVRFSGHGQWNRALALAAGSVVPGASPRRLAIGGDYTPSATTVSEFVLAGDDAGTGYGRIDVASVARLAGSVSVTLADGFVPEACQAFEVMTWASMVGSFANTGPIDLGGGMSLRQMYTPTGLTLIAYSTGSWLNVGPLTVGVSEDGATDTYDICVATAPAATETITISPDSQVSVDPTSAVFDATNWQLPQTITVSAVDDTVHEPTPHVGVITHSFGDLGIASVISVTAMIDDNDLPSTPPTVDAGGPYTVDEGGSVGLSATGDDPEGTALAYAWDLDADGSFETAGQSVAFSAAGLDGPSSHTVWVRATDGEGLTDVDSATVNVMNVAPGVSVVQPVADASFPVGGSVAVRATFADPGTADGHTCRIDWGDSSSSAGTVASGACTGSHAYGATGEFTIRVTVTDDDAGAGSDTVAIRVVSPVVVQKPWLLLLDKDAIDRKFGGGDGKPVGDDDDDDDERNKGKSEAARYGSRLELPWFAARTGREIVLGSGLVGGEGWFALKQIPAGWTLANYRVGTVEQRLLRKVPRVTPLRATGLGMLEGHTVCAVVYARDINVKYKPLVGDLSGKTVGVVAFKVLDVGASSSRANGSLPQVRIKILSAATVCGQSLGLFTDAPEPRSPRDPFDVTP